jgi:hypothetical protein
MDLSGAVVPKPKNKGGAPKGRVISEATREALKKGFEKLKSIREAKKKEKEEKALQVMKEAEVKKEVLNSNEPVAAVVPLETPASSKPKRQRMKTVSKNEFLTFKDDILKVIDGKLSVNSVKVEAPVPAPVAVPPPAPAPVPVVEKVLSGNDLLNKIFFNR